MGGWRRRRRIFVKPKWVSREEEEGEGGRRKACVWVGGWVNELSWVEENEAVGMNRVGGWMGGWVGGWAEEEEGEEEEEENEE